MTIQDRMNVLRGLSEGPESAVAATFAAAGVKGTPKGGLPEPSCGCCIYINYVVRGVDGAKASLLGDVLNVTVDGELVDSFKLTGANASFRRNFDLGLYPSLITR